MGHEKVSRGVDSNAMGVVMDGNSNITEALKRILDFKLQLKDVSTFEL